MATTERLVTAEELARMPGECGRFELLDGRLVELSPANGRHNELLGVITAILMTFVRPRRLGAVLSGDTGVFLRRNPDRVRAPDVCFIARERLPDGRVPETFLDLVPDLIVEIVSPNDTAVEVRQKTEEWLHAGARLVWTVYPGSRSIGVATSPDAARYLHEGDTLDAEPVLPCFSVAVAELFADL